jgi:hypothetical protein
VIEAAECGLATSRIGKHDLQGNLVRAQDDLARQRDVPPSGALGKNCHGCRKDNHVRNVGPVLTCKLSVHPHFNKVGKWSESEHGKRYAAAGKSEIKWGKDEKGDPVTTGTATTGAAKANKKAKWENKKYGMLHLHDVPTISVAHL